MPTLKSFEEFVAWKKAHALAVDFYGITNGSELIMISNCGDKCVSLPFPFPFLPTLLKATKEIQTG